MLFWHQIVGLKAKSAQNWASAVFKKFLQGGFHAEFMPKPHQIGQLA